MTLSPATTIDDARRLVVEAVLDIAPDLERGELSPETHLREDVELDSMDHANLMVALSELIGADIPERDYSLLQTIDECAGYIRDRAGAA